MPAQYKSALRIYAKLRTVDFSLLQHYSPVQTAYQVSRPTASRLYLVGGAIRDILIGNFSGDDFDFVVGKDFETVVAEFAKEVSGTAIPWDRNQTRVVFTLQGRKVTVDFAYCRGSDIHSDLYLRDFTINAMALDIAHIMSTAQPELIDPMGGRDDVGRKIVRVCSDASFSDDPLRILRGIRFARKYHFNIDPQTVALMSNNASRITTVSAERVIREFFSVLHLPQVCKTLHDLRHCGILSILLPELEKLVEITQDFPHEYNVVDHSLRTVHNIEKLLDEQTDLLEGYEDICKLYFNETIEEGVTRRSLLMFSGLLHDSGKVHKLQNAHNRKVFYGHEKKGALINKEIAKRLGLGKHAQRIIEQTTEYHMRIFHLTQLPTITARAKKRFMNDIKGVTLEVLLLALADVMAKGEQETHAEKIKATRNEVKELIRLFFTSPVTLTDHEKITGSDVMRLLNLAEGPDVGNILQEIHERERSGLIKSREEALAWLEHVKKQ